MIKIGGSLNHKIENERLILSLNGEIDHHSAVILRINADELIYRYRPNEVVLDLSEIEFMDSSGLGFIMGRYALMSKLGGTVVLRNPNDRVRKIITLAGLERIIKTERINAK